jgi:CHAT domain-containing protein/Flp pilus assembly protein TadD
MRQYEKADNVTEPKVKVHIEIDMELTRFDEMFQKLLWSGLAGFLEISPSSVRITSIEQGSVKITIELPARSAERLLDAYKRNDSELSKYLAPLVLLHLRRKATRREWIRSIVNLLLTTVTSWFGRQPPRPTKVDPEARRIMQLHQRAAQAHKDSNYATSVRLYEQLKAFAERLGNEELIAKINRDMGYSYFRLGTPEALQKAVELGLAARKTFESLELSKLLPNVDMNIGNAYEQQKEYEKARMHYQQARQLFEQIRRPDGITLADYNIGRIHFEQGNYYVAITHLEKARLGLQRLGWPEADDAAKRLVEAYQISATFQWRLGRPLEALHGYEKLLKVEEIVNWPDVRAGALNDMAAIENEVGMHEQARDHLRTSLEINAHQLHNPALEAICLVNLGNSQNALGKLDDAEKSYKTAWHLCTGLPHSQAVDVQIGVHIGRGYNSALRDQYDAARSHFVSALRECQRNNRRDREIGVLENLGNLEMRLGNFAEARDHYASALRHCPNDSLGQRHMAGLHSSLALAEMRLGDVSKAAGDMSIDLAEKETHYNESREHFAKSLEHFEKADRLHQQVDDPVRQARNLINWSFLDRRALDFATAQTRLEEALRISESVKNTLLAAQAKFNLAVALADQHMFPQAQALCRETLKLVEELGLQHTDLAINVHVLLGRLLMIDRQDVEAYDFLSKAIAQIEAWRIGVARETHRLAIADYKSVAYQYMIEVCYRLGHSDQEKQHETCYFMERARGRALLDQFARLPVSAPEELPSDLVAEEETLIEGSRQAHLILESTTDLERQQALLKTIDSHRSKLERLYDEMEKSAPQYVHMRRGDPITYQDLQAMMDDFDTTVALVEFCTLPYKIIVLVLRSGESEPVVTQVSVTHDQLRRHVENYWREVVEYPRRGDIGQRWQELAEPLLADVLPHLEGAELVYLVPHGLLHYLPLHALQVDGEYLIDRFPIAYAPSAAVLSRVIQRTAGVERTTNGHRALVLGYTPHEREREVFEGEAEQVAEFFGTEAHLGQKATGALLREKGTQYDTLHLSCHGFFDPTDPLASGLQLADGVLTARDIMGLKLNADLVTLSACQTARSEISRGDELVGLTRALLYAGASSVLVTLWSVDAVAALELMGDFYSRLRGNGGTKVKPEAVALREAMLEMRKKREHPYYWAPFILVGDWR